MEIEFQRLPFLFRHLIFRSPIVNYESALSQTFCFFEFSFK